MRERRKGDQQQLGHWDSQIIAIDSVHLLLQWSSGQGVELLRVHLGRLHLEGQPTRIGNRSTKVCVVDSRAGLYPSLFWRHAASHCFRVSASVAYSRRRSSSSV